jgi:hypothetical protein
MFSSFFHVGKREFFFGGGAMNEILWTLNAFGSHGPPFFKPLWTLVIIRKSPHNTGRHFKVQYFSGYKTPFGRNLFQNLNLSHLSSSKVQ